MATGTITQQRTSYTDIAGVTQYQIYTLFENNVGINDGVFLYKINDVLDPSADTFTRTCGVSDMTDYERGRVAAITAGDDYYREAALTIHYDNIATAVSAATVIIEQVSGLLDTYTTYIDEFFGTDATAVPTGDLTLFQQLVNQAEAQHLVYVAAQDTTVDAQAAYDDAVGDLSGLATTVNSVDSLLAALTSLDSDMGLSYTAAVLGYGFAVSAGLDTDPTYTAAWAQFSPVIAGTAAYSVAAMRNDVISVLADTTSLSGTLNTQLSTAQALVTSTQETLVAATADEAAQLALRTTYANEVLALDPTYVFSWV